MTAAISPATGAKYSSAFDAIAEQYDATFSSSVIGRLQRRPVWDELKKAFRAGDRVLDIGCGTGVDACFLAERGVEVVACDSSMRMLHVAQGRIANLSSTAGSVQLRLLPAEEISALRDSAPLDGTFSNFGPVNCVDDIAKLASDLSLLLRPPASVLLCVIGPMCLWETAWYLLHGKLQKAFRRFRRGGVEAKFGDGVVRVHYLSVRTIRDAFAPEFCLKGIRGIGVAVPPSYLEAWARRFPGAMKMAANADGLLGRCPGIRLLGDHVLLRFERIA